MNLSKMGENIKHFGMTEKHNCSHEEVKKHLKLDAYTILLYLVQRFFLAICYKQAACCYAGCGTGISH
jgi:hypothetical protein